METFKTENTLDDDIKKQVAAVCDKLGKTVIKDHSEIAKLLDNTTNVPC